MQKNASLLAIVAVHTAENEPSEVHRGAERTGLDAARLDPFLLWHELPRTAYEKKATNLLVRISRKDSVVCSSYKYFFHKHLHVFLKYRYGAHIRNALRVM